MNELILSRDTHQAELAKVSPEFRSVYHHMHVASVSAGLLIGANIAAGACLRQLSLRRKTRAGRPAKDAPKNALAWSEQVRQETGGRSWEYCRRTIKAAEDLAGKLKNKRNADAVHVRELIEAPEDRDWTIDDYQAVARIVGENYDAVTWTEMLQEMGILRKPVQPSPGTGERIGGPKATPLSLIDRATATASAYYRALREFEASDEERKTQLAALPLEPTGDPSRPGLSEIREQLANRIAELDEIITLKS